MWQGKHVYITALSTLVRLVSTLLHRVASHLCNFSLSLRHVRQVKHLTQHEPFIHFENLFLFRHLIAHRARPRTSVVVISIRSVLSTPHLDSSTISKSNSIYCPNMVDVTTVTSVFATVLTGFPRRVLGFEGLEEIMLAVTPGTVVL
jgi:hypothetical protein